MKTAQSSVVAERRVRWLRALQHRIRLRWDGSGKAPMLFDGNPLPMWIVDVETLQFLEVNRSAQEHYGYSRDEFLKMTLRDIRPPDEVSAMEAEVRQGLNTQRAWTHLRKDGSRMLVKIAANNMTFRGRMARFAVAEDVTESMTNMAELVRLAHYDSLTGLPNRMLLERRLREACDRADDRGGRAAVICVDLDRFKLINDRFGHPGGDECLKQVAGMLTQRLRGMDTVARTGGEEFTLVLAELDDVGEAEKVGEALLRSFRKPITVEGETIEVSASMGIAIYPSDGRDLSNLYRLADAAMYRAKRAGGGRFVLVSPDVSTVATESAAIEAHMHEMLESNGFQIMYQPQFAADGAIRSLEALLRLPHPQLGNISPDTFIPIAEECGMIEPLGLWVIRQVCQQMKTWEEMLGHGTRVAVNVSPLQIRKKDFPAKVLEVVKESGITPSCLELEITERVMLNFDEVAAHMRQLAAAGITFAVDDFGMGYSSLQHLHRLPIATVKIDRSFVQRICGPGGAYPIVEAIISVGHSLGMQVIAEGVEDEGQHDAVRRLGCDAVQGMLLCAPVPARQIPAMLMRKRAD